MAHSKMIKAAVIGVGSMGMQHARVYNDMEDVELVGVADPNHEALQAVGRRFKVPIYAHYQKLLDEVRPDLVSVAVPTHLHSTVGRHVIERGVHVLVEKPLADSIEDAQALIDSAKAHSVKLAVGHVERFNPAVTELKRRLDAGELGRIFQAHARRLSPFPSRIMDMGVTMDLATHDIDVMGYLVNSEVERVYAEVERKAHLAHEDMLSGLIRFKSGVIGVLDINWLTPTKIRQLTVTGERGMFLVDYLLQDVYLYENSAYAKGRWDSLSIFKGTQEGDTTKLHIEKQEPLRVELESFVEAVVDDRDPVVAGQAGMATLLLAQKLLESGKKKIAIDLN